MFTSGRPSGHGEAIGNHGVSAAAAAAVPGIYGVGAGIALHGAGRRAPRQLEVLRLRQRGAPPRACQLLLALTAPGPFASSGGIIRAYIARALRAPSRCYWSPRRPAVSQLACVPPQNFPSRVVCNRESCGAAKDERADNHALAATTATAQADAPPRKPTVLEMAEAAVKKAAEKRLEKRLDVDFEARRLERIAEQEARDKRQAKKRAKKKRKKGQHKPQGVATDTMVATAAVAAGAAAAVASPQKLGVISDSRAVAEPQPAAVATHGGPDTPGL